MPDSWSARYEDLRTREAPAETARQAHEVRVVQRFIRSIQAPPPQTETVGIMPMRKYAFNTIRDAVIVAAVGDLTAGWMNSRTCQRTQ